jgi:putative NADH-flavin reductase
MKILVIGGTGRTGRPLIEQALERSITVHAIVRDKSKLSQDKNLILFEGMPSDPAIIEKAIGGCTAVLSTLNISRTSDFPWSPLRSPKDLLSVTIKQLLAVCDKTGCKRIILTTAWGVNETKKELPAWFRWFIDHSNIKYPYNDHGRVEDIVKTSMTDWTVVRPTGLINSKKPKQILTAVDGNPRPRLTISRHDVARFMLDTLEQNSYIRKMVTISSK